MRAIVLYIFVFSILCTGFGGTSAPGSCEDALTKIAAYLQGYTAGKEVRMRFTIQNIEAGVAGNKIPVSIYKTATRLRYENLFFLIYQDEEHRVTILKEARRLIIQKAVPNTAADPWQGVSPEAQIDSLKKLALDISCTEGGGEVQVQLQFPEKLKGIQQPLKTVKFYYKQKKVTKAQYDFYSEEEKIQIYEYEAGDIPLPVFNGSALEQVMIDERINEKYKNYNIKDLR